MPDRDQVINLAMRGDLPGLTRCDHANEEREADDETVSGGDVAVGLPGAPQPLDRGWVEPRSEPW
jgi:hypothetical protein